MNAYTRLPSPAVLADSLKRAQNPWGIYDRPHIAYELSGGRGYTLHRGSSTECASYVLRNPRGPRGGSAHVREGV